MPKHLGTMAIIALVLGLLDAILMVTGSPLRIPFSLTTLAVILLSLGILIRN